MASFTGGVSRNVLGRLGTGTARVALRMTSCTVLRCAFKNAVNVAGFASDNLMRAADVKPCAHMVKRGARLLGMRNAYKANLKENDQSKRNCGAHTNNHLGHDSPESMR